MLILEWVGRFLGPSRPISVYRGIEVHRCRTDGSLVTKYNLHEHGGHYVLDPVTLSRKEKTYLWLKSLSSK